YSSLNVADAYAAGSTAMIEEMTGDDFGGIGITPEATARMGIRFVGRELQEFIGVSGGRAAELAREYPDEALALARGVGNGDGQVIRYEVHGAFGPILASVSMRRHLSARQDCDALHVGYNLALDCSFKEGANAAERFIVALAIGRLACAHVDCDVAQLV